jgi:hypothetical protein
MMRGNIAIALKWNIGCESERRDHLHDRIVKHRNGFWRRRQTHIFKSGAAPISSSCVQIFPS